MAPNAESASASVGLADPYAVRDWLKQYPKQLALLDQFEIQLRLGRLVSKGRDEKGATIDRRAVTVRTVELVKTIIGGTRWRTPAQLVALLRGLGRELHQAGGFREPAIGNVVRRIIAAVREEVLNGIAANTTSNQSTPISNTKKNELSLESMLWALPQHIKPTSSTSSERHTSASRRSTRSESMGDALEASDLPPQFFQNRPDLKQSVMEAIQEITSDLEDLYKNISEQATNHIHAGEIILTYGRSRTVEKFLKTAADKKLRFTVVVCEHAPTYEGHEMAKSLASSGIDTIVIPDSAIFGMMARVNKVILPAHAVLANGGLIAPSGSNIVVLGASQNSVPVICLTGLFKLTPMFPHEGQETLNDLVSPSSVMSYAERNENPVLKDVDFVNPVHDYIRPQLINLYVTNVGSFQPSYIYRLLAEHYHSDDWESFE